MTVTLACFLKSDWLWLLYISCYTKGQKCFQYPCNKVLTAAMFMTALYMHPVTEMKIILLKYCSLNE